MKKWTKLLSLVIAVAMISVTGLAGCQQDKPKTDVTAKDQTPKDKTATEGTTGAVEQPKELSVKKVDFSEKSKLYVIENEGVEPEITVRFMKDFDADAAGKVKVNVNARQDKAKVVMEQTFDFTMEKDKMDDSFSFKLPKFTQPDYYEANIQVIFEDEVISEKTMQFGVLRKAAVGVRENSPFGLGLEASEQELNLSIAEKMGVKWIRSIGNVTDPGKIWEKKDGMLWDDPKNKAGLKRVQQARNRIKTLNDHGIMPLGYVNYNIPWNIEPLPGLGAKTGTWQNRPADLDAQAKMVYHMIAPLQDLVKNWEIWNEPWIHSWTWGTGEASDYRLMAKKIYDLVKKDFPDVNIIGGGSVPYNRDIVYAKGSENTGYIDGSVSHAYGLPDPAQMGYVKIQKTIDKKWSKSAGRGGLWQTELGTNVTMFPELPAEERKWGVAKTVAPTFLLHMLGAGETPLHVFWFMLDATKTSANDFNMYEYKTKSPNPSVVAYSAMTHFLEDAKLKEDIYPESKSTWGCLFDKQGKGTAAIYLDKEYAGKVTLNSAKDIKVFDYLGTEIFDGSKDSITLDLKPWETIYVQSDKTTQELKTILKSAQYDLVQGVKVSPLSFTGPVKEAKSVDIKVENVSVEKIEGKLNMTLPEGWEMENSQNTIALNPGEIKVISVPIKKYTASDVNRYLVNYSFDIEKPAKNTVKGGQTIQAAYATYKTIKIDGNLDDWNDVEGVTMVSNGNPDYMEAIMDPTKVKAAVKNDGNAKSVVYTAKTAWDNNYFYFMAKVPDYQHSANDTFAKDPYKFPFEADSIQLAFDCLSKNPEDFLQGDKHYEKAIASDVDYIMVATLAKGDVPELHRELAPGTNYQGYFPTNKDLNPKLGPMDAKETSGKEGRIKIVRDKENRITSYEIAIAWNSLGELYKQLKGLGKGQKAQTNFAFWINDTGGKGKNISTWTREAGQVESGTYGFAPFWRTGSKTTGGRIITRWGFVK